MSDWLNDLYANNKYWLISRHPSFSKKFNLTEDESISIKFIANRNTIYAYMVEIGLDFKKLEEVKNRLHESEIALKIIKKLDRLFNKEVYIILFDKHSNNFSVTDDFSNYIDMNSKELEEYFKKINPKLVKDQGGVYKQINKKRSDNFHTWVRKKLSKYVVISDIDLLSISPHMAIELKKVKEDIRTWKPYVDDLSIYRCMKKIFDENDIKFYIVSYPRDEDNQIAIHHITKLDERCIYGKKIICSPNIAIESEDFFIPEDTKEYKSENRWKND